MPLTSIFKTNRPIIESELYCGVKRVEDGEGGLVKGFTF